MDPRKTDWDSLFKNQIPFKREMLLLLYHMPGVVVAFGIGLMANMLLEEILKRISKKLAESTYVTFVWIGLVVYLVFFTRFDFWIAEKIHWYQIVPPPR